MFQARFFLNELQSTCLRLLRLLDVGCFHCRLLPTTAHVSLLKESLLRSIRMIENGDRELLNTKGAFLKAP
ncbi:MAG: hypothetical protein JWO13_2639 [Acidobacteriales bacterium]|nr:hypothetical protein [Terriglobales bacterium]